MFERKFIFFFRHNSLQKSFFVAKISTQSAGFPLVCVVPPPTPSMNFFEESPFQSKQMPTMPAPKNNLLPPLKTFVAFQEVIPRKKAKYRKLSLTSVFYS